MKDQHPLDNLIRQRITELPEQPPRHWEALERKLEPVSKQDALLVTKLASLSPTATKGSWERLESKLTAAEHAAADTVDEAVTEALLITTPVAVSGWAQLAARLELTGKRREMVACMKITESVVLLSLVIVLLRMVVTDGAKVPVLAERTDDIETAFPLAIGVTDEVTRKPAILRAIVNTSTPPSRKIVIVAPLAAPEAADPISKDELDFGGLGVRKAPALTETIGGIKFTPSPRDWSVKPALELPSLLFGEPVNYGLDFFVSPVDVNQVVTKADQRYGVSGQANLSTGFSSGLLLNVSQGTNTLQTGLVYGYRAYAPAEILLIEGEQPVRDGDDPVSYGRLRYRTVSVPLIYERRFVHNDGWRFSGGLGIAMNIILSSDFALNENYNEEDLKRAWASYKDAAIANQTLGAEGRAFTSKDLAFTDPAEGYLEGGSLIKNSSLYVSGHFTAERFINDRWSLYFSPTLSRVVTVRDNDGGKGPLGDRIHGTMLRLGARVRLTDN